MIQKEKELLLKDLCARLPYGVVGQCEIDASYDTSFDTIPQTHKFNAVAYGLKEDFKPYLFPLSSMTEEQCYKLKSIRSSFQDCWKYIKTPIPISICNFEQIDWFNKNQFDFRGLIPKGIAIDATGLNIY